VLIYTNNKNGKVKIMKKIIRKGLAFGLAVVMLLGNFGNVAYADTKEENMQESSDPVYQLTDLEYNDAASFAEHIVLIKNGEWAYGDWNDDTDD